MKKFIVIIAEILAITNSAFSQTADSKVKFQLSTLKEITYGVEIGTINLKENTFNQQITIADEKIPVPQKMSSLGLNAYFMYWEMSDITNWSKYGVYGWNYRTSYTINKLGIYLFEVKIYDIISIRPSIYYISAWSGFSDTSGNDIGWDKQMKDCQDKFRQHFTGIGGKVNLSISTFNLDPFTIRFGGYISASKYETGIGGSIILSVAYSRFSDTYYSRPKKHINFENNNQKYKDGIYYK